MGAVINWQLKYGHICDLRDQAEAEADRLRAELAEIRHRSADEYRVLVQVTFTGWETYVFDTEEQAQVWAARYPLAHVRIEHRAASPWTKVLDKRTSSSLHS